MTILTLSIGRNILAQGSRDRKRMTLYAGHTDALHIIVLTRRVHGYEDEIHEEKLHLYPTNSRNRPFMLIDAFRIAYRILKSREKGAYTITAQDPLELGMLSCLLSWMTGVPYTVQVHGDYYSPHWTMGSRANAFRRRMLPSVVRHAAKVRIVSDRVARSFAKEGIHAKTVHVLPIRPELEAFVNVKRTRPRSDVFRVLTASRLTPEKNIPLLIRAFAKLHAQYPRTELRIVGDGEERAHIEEFITVCGLQDAVTLLPWTVHVEDEMANADVFALASLHESYGLVLIEALATGVPIVATDVGCVGDVVKDGEHGVIVPVGDEGAFTQALVSLYENEPLRIRTGMHGRDLGVSLMQYSEDAYAKEWVAAHSA